MILFTINLPHVEHPSIITVAKSVCWCTLAGKYLILFRPGNAAMKDSTVSFAVHNTELSIQEKIRGSWSPHIQKFGC
jgi:hypothetical protein